MVMLYKCNICGEKHYTNKCDKKTKNKSSNSNSVNKESKNISTSLNFADKDWTDDDETYDITFFTTIKERNLVSNCKGTLMNNWELEKFGIENILQQV
eukprot:14274701-Ditylum_brightwellii.AAC.1